MLLVRVVTSLQASLVMSSQLGDVITATDSCVGLVGHLNM